jgi:soluble lytic murein transglycosylase-like protein
LAAGFAQTPTLASERASEARSLPNVLAVPDARLYREIFALQGDGAWREADARIDRLGDPTLMGYVLAQRYLHPTAYRSAYPELRDWLERYADHPQAERIYRLAKIRQGDGAAAPRAPERISLRVGAPPDGEPYRSTKQLNKVERAEARELKRKVRRDVRNTRLTDTEALLRGPEARRLLDQVEIDQCLARVAVGWFYHGDPAKAFALASRAADRSGLDAPLAQWIAGLSAWRLGRLDRAADYFEQLSRSPRASVWTSSAGAYWAARSHLRLRNPDKMSDLLARAAAHPRTFYGLLARRALGMRIGFPVRERGLTGPETQILKADPAARRALALLQLGERARAKSELKRLDGDGDPALARALLALDEATGFPDIALRLAGGLAKSPGRWAGSAVENGLYPIPPWQPDQGFRIDRALVYALIRQESRFDPRAENPSGASGLMQIMPRTADYVLRERRFRGDGRRQLFDPALNLDVGQRYIAHLLNQDGVDGDLLRLTVAYNGGPGNLLKWLDRMEGQDDPLLFIESIPSFETRRFIEHVLANFWIYRARLGQPLPSLEAMAAGDSPAYVSLDRPTQEAERL